MNVDTLRILVAKGLSPTDILEVAEAMEGELRVTQSVTQDVTDSVTQVATTRATAAQRQARYRAKKAAEMSGDVTTSDAQSDAQSDVTSDVTQRNANPLSPSPLLSPHTPQTTPHPLTPVDKHPARKADDYPMPEGVDPQHWKDFLTNRRRKQFANTDTAHKKLLGDIKRWTSDEWPPGRLIEHAAASGWGSVNNPVEDTRYGKSRNNRRGNAKPVSGFSAVLRDVASGGTESSEKHGRGDQSGSLGGNSASF